MSARNMEKVNIALVLYWYGRKGRISKELCKEVSYSASTMVSEIQDEIELEHCKKGKLVKLFVFTKL